MTSHCSADGVQLLLQNRLSTLPLSKAPSPRSKQRRAALFCKGKRHKSHSMNPKSRRKLAKPARRGERVQRALPPRYLSCDLATVIHTPSPPPSHDRRRSAVSHTPHCACSRASNPPRCMPSLDILTKNAEG